MVCGEYFLAKSSVKKRLILLSFLSGNYRATEPAAAEPMSVKTETARNSSGNRISPSEAH